MEIVKEGKLPEKKRKFICVYCGTVFIANDNEYVMCDAWSYLHDNLVAKCNCPMCGKLNFLTESR